MTNNKRHLPFSKAGKLPSDDSPEFKSLDPDKQITVRRAQDAFFNTGRRFLQEISDEDAPDKRQLPFDTEGHQKMIKAGHEAIDGRREELESVYNDLGMAHLFTEDFEVLRAKVQQAIKRSPVGELSMG